MLLLLPVILLTSSWLTVIQNAEVEVESRTGATAMIYVAVMLVLVLVLKDSLMTSAESLSLWRKSLSLSWSWSLWPKSLSFSWSWIKVLKYALEFTMFNSWDTCFQLRQCEFLPRGMECRRGLAMIILFVCLSVRLSVCQTNGLWQNGRKICLDFYTVRKII